ncbi:hypothetical protein KSF78_0000501, partial [Schistosoma japonicum]
LSLGLGLELYYLLANSQEVAASLHCYNCTDCLIVDINTTTVDNCGGCTKQVTIKETTHISNVSISSSLISSTLPTTTLSTTTTITTITSEMKNSQ